MAVKPGPHGDTHDGRSKVSHSRLGSKQIHWMKRYRTELAASTSSVLSTFVAVRALIFPFL